MCTGPEPGKAVVVGYDGSPGSELALDWAYEHARLERRPLEIFHATDVVLGAAAPAALAHASSRADPHAPLRQRSLVEDAAERVRVPGGARVRTVVHHGWAPAGLVGASRDAAVVTVGATGQGATGSMRLGPVARAVAMGARCPVVVVRRSHATGLRSVLVGIDCGIQSDAELAFAFRIAAQRSCPLTVLRCDWDLTDHTADVVQRNGAGHDLRRSELEAAVALHVEQHPHVEVRLRLSSGLPDRRLIEATHDHDLVVIGHHKLPLLDTVASCDVSLLVLREGVGDVAVVPIGTSHDGV